jgi:hypothetical protein
VALASDQLELQRKEMSAAPPARGDRLHGQDPVGHLRSYLVLLLVWLIGCAYAGSHLMRGWVPHDEGAFAQSADRVLHGEVPHRDYTEIYTGGLAYLNAFAFRYLGENLATLRMVLFIFFFFWVPIFYWIASRFVSDWIAGGVTLLAVAWSLPNYSAAVPSWYNLFFATFGLAAVLLYVEKRSARWLFLAGLAGGLSFLAKNAALFYAAGVLLFFFSYEQSLSASSNPGEKNRRGLLYTSFVASSMLAIPIALAVLVAARGGMERSVDFVLPSAALAVLILVRESRFAGQPSRERFRTLLGMCVPFAVGFLLPVLLFSLLYVHAGALAAFVNGVFVLPFKRVSGALADPPDLATIAPSLCVATTLALGASLRGAARWVVTVAAAIVGAYYLVSSAHSMANYRAAWHTAYWLIPVVALSGGLVLWPRGTRKEPLANSGAYQRLFAVLALTSLGGLIQYPFSAPIYFCYVAPLVILAAVGVLVSFPSIPRPLLAVVFAWFSLLVIVRITPPFISSTGFYYQADPETQVLTLPRAGELRIDAQSAETYQRLIPVIQKHAGERGIYAGPDCPEIYFLAGYSNATRALFDFFEQDYPSYSRVLDLVDRQPIQVVVLNTKPPFSAALPEAVHDALLKRFPKNERVGKFEVLWRD